MSGFSSVCFFDMPSKMPEMVFFERSSFLLKSVFEGVRGQEEREREGVFE